MIGIFFPWSPFINTGINMFLKYEVLTFQSMSFLMCGRKGSHASVEYVGEEYKAPDTELIFFRTMSSYILMTALLISTGLIFHGPRFPKHHWYLLNDTHQGRYRFIFLNLTLLLSGTIFLSYEFRVLYLKTFQKIIFLNSPVSLSYSLADPHCTFTPIYNLCQMFYLQEI